MKLFAILSCHIRVIVLYLYLKPNEMTPFKSSGIAMSTGKWSLIFRKSL